MPKICLIGAFPPPVHGISETNAVMCDRLREMGVKPIVVDLGAASLGRSFRARLARFPKVLRGFGRLMTSRGLRGSAFYMSISGGLGQVYEVLFLLLGRLQGMRIYLHHHSFAYLNARSRLTATLITLAGRAATHVVQSPGMVAKLRAQYPTARRVVAVSNTALLSGNATPRRRDRQFLRTIGFLSNICKEKGVFEFLDLVATLEKQGVDVRARLAGPFQDAETERLTRERLGALRTVEYVGPKYGVEKEDFFASIDVLIFPTRYVHETESRVTPEAMQHAVPVITYHRGCIPEIVGPESGLVLDPSFPFVPAAVAKIEEWMASPESFQAASRAARSRFEEIQRDALEQWASLVEELCQGVRRQ